MHVLLPRIRCVLLNIAFGSAAEARYLLQLSFRLKFLPEPEFTSADAAYDDLLRALQKLLQVVARMTSRRTVTVMGTKYRTY